MCLTISAAQAFKRLRYSPLYALPRFVGCMEEANGSSLGFDFLQYQALRAKTSEEASIKACVVLATSVLFVLLNSIMFSTLKTKPTFCEMSRYILFSQMLLGDSIQLTVTSMLYSFAVINLTLTKAVCSLFVLVSTVTFNVSPLNLAVMSLERYVAICFPLRHAEIATPRRTKIAIAVVWFLSSVNSFTDVVYTAVSDRQYFSSRVPCTREQLFVAKWQYDMFQGFNSFFFVTVGVTIIYTYAGIMVTARSIKAKKASRTVLLHLAQLGLCLTSFLYGSIERALAVFSSSIFIQLRYLNFIFILLLPRCLSPLIYGLRDESVRAVFLYYLHCRPRRTKPI